MFMWIIISQNDVTRILITSVSAAIDRYLLPGDAQQQTLRRPLLLSIDGTDRCSTVPLTLLHKLCRQR